jgi:predicted N-acetyltransferase YhbS
VSGYVNERSVPAFGHEPLAEFDAGHAAEPDVEYQAVELRMLRVREERLRRGIGDRLNARRTEQPAKRSAKALVVLDDGDIYRCGAGGDSAL